MIFAWSRQPGEEWARIRRPRSSCCSWRSSLVNSAGDRAEEPVRPEVVRRSLTDDARQPTRATSSDPDRRGEPPERRGASPILDVRDLSVRYGEFLAVRDVTVPIRENEITALIGPSGCGKTTVLRCLNRMNDLIDGATDRGQRAVPRGRPVRPATWIPSRSGAGSGWCSRNPIPSPSRSRTTSRSARRSAGIAATLAPWSRNP